MCNFYFNYTSIQTGKRFLNHFYFFFARSLAHFVHRVFLDTQFTYLIHIKRNRVSSFSHEKKVELKTRKAKKKATTMLSIEKKIIIYPNSIDTQRRPVAFNSLSLSLCRFLRNALWSVSSSINWEKIVSRIDWK